MTRWEIIGQTDSIVVFRKVQESPPQGSAGFEARRTVRHGRSPTPPSWWPRPARKGKQ